MSETEKIKELKIQQKELEKKIKYEKEMFIKNDSNINIDILRNELKRREYDQKSNNYSKSCIVAKFIDRDMIPVLTSTVNLFEIMEKKIKKLEEKIEKMESDT